MSKDGVRTIDKQEATELVNHHPTSAVNMLVNLSHDLAELTNRWGDYDALKAQVETLKAQKATDSSNSSKPPSSDGYTKPAPKSLRKKSGKPCGGQVGHAGHHLEQRDQPDICMPFLEAKSCCSQCRQSLEDVGVSYEEVRQVFDIPPSQPLEVTEYRAQVKICSCGHREKGDFPQGVTGPTQYGPNLKAEVVYLNQYQHLPYKRIAEYMNERYACSLSVGTIKNWVQEMYDRLATTEEKIKQHIKDAPIVNLDETGMRVDGELCWAHSASTADATAYYGHAKRGQEAMDAFGVIGALKGDAYAVHDGLASYKKYENCLHGLCNAHHLRELTFINEVVGQPWALEMIIVLCEIKQAVEQAIQAQETCLAPEVNEALLKRYQTIVDTGYAANPLPEPTTPPKKGRVKKTKARNLVERLDIHKTSVLAFMNDFRVPFDNNQAERDLRMVKLKQKVSGCFRVEAGFQAFCRIRGYCVTVRKNGIGVLTALLKAFQGKPWCWDTS